MRSIKDFGKTQNHLKTDLDFPHSLFTPIVHIGNTQMDCYLGILSSEEADSSVGKGYVRIFAGREHD